MLRHSLLTLTLALGARAQSDAPASGMATVQLVAAWIPGPTAQMPVR